MEKYLVVAERAGGGRESSAHGRRGRRRNVGGCRRAGRRRTVWWRWWLYSRVVASSRAECRECVSVERLSAPLPATGWMSLASPDSSLLL